MIDEAALIAEARRIAVPEADIRFDVFNAFPGLFTPKDSDVVRFVQGPVSDQDLSKPAFGTEAGIVSEQLGIPAVVCGPGAMDQGLKPDAFMSLAQRDACDRMTDRLLQSYVRAVLA